MMLTICARGTIGNAAFQMTSLEIPSTTIWCTGAHQCLLPCTSLCCTTGLPVALLQHDKRAQAGIDLQLQTET